MRVGIVASPLVVVLLTLLLCVRARACVLLPHTHGMSSVAHVTRCGATLCWTLCVSACVCVWARPLRCHLQAAVRMRELHAQDVWVWVQAVDALCLRYLLGDETVVEGDVLAGYHEQFAFGATQRVKVRRPCCLHSPVLRQCVVCVECVLRDSLLCSADVRVCVCRHPFHAPVAHSLPRTVVLAVALLPILFPHLPRASPLRVLRCDRAPSWTRWTS
jgi:hypothetical protein